MYVAKFTPVNSGFPRSKISNWSCKNTDAKHEPTLNLKTQINTGITKLTFKNVVKLYQFLNVLKSNVSHEKSLP